MVAVRRIPARARQRLVSTGTLALAFACAFMKAAATAWSGGQVRAADGFAAGALLFLAACAGLWARADLNACLRRRDGN